MADMPDNIDIEARVSDSQVIADILKDHFKPTVLKVTGREGEPETEILILPDGNGGLNAQSVKRFGDEYRDSPERRKGTAVMTDLDSLIAHVNRFKDADSALFGIDHPDAPGIIGVINYHERVNPAEGETPPEDDQPPRPRFGDHRCRYDFPLSDEWKAWAAADGEAMEMVDFAEFLEDRIVDVMNPPDFLRIDFPQIPDGTTDAPAPETDTDKRLHDLMLRIGGRACGPSSLMELSCGLKVNEAAKVAQTNNLSTGEVQIRFETEHQDADGKPLKVPNLFLLAISVFRGGPLYRVPVRLRYRLRGGTITWIMQMHRPDLVFNDAFDQACKRAAVETGLPLFMGQPES